jgi:hypothetical protein
MQLKQRIGKGAAVGAAVDDGAIFDAREVPEVPIGAPVLLVEKGANFPADAR